VLREQFAKSRLRVEAGADRGAALRQRVEIFTATRSRAMPLSTWAAYPENS
jgi:hypothetical protein